jgi:hypothetical protein
MSGLKSVKITTVIGIGESLPYIANVCQDMISFIDIFVKRFISADFLKETSDL